MTDIVSRARPDRAPPLASRQADRPAIRLRDALAAVVRDWRRERALRRTVDRLGTLSDHDLRDIGLHRGDIREGVLARSRET